MHKLSKFYQTIYQIGKKIPKRDKFGLHFVAEKICLESLELSVAAAFENPINKRNILKSLRIKIEILKCLIRNAQELNILTSKIYLDLQKDLQEISKMTNGWIKYLDNKRAE